MLRVSSLYSSAGAASLLAAGSAAELLSAGAAEEAVLGLEASSPLHAAKDITIADAKSTDNTFLFI